MEKEKVFNQGEFSRQLRPAWTPVNMALMILFFATGLWILGLAMIAYMLYGKEMGVDFSNWGRAKSSVNKAFDGKNWKAYAPSGNEAFDDWRRSELNRLEEERKKLDEARREFEEYARELRRARDEEEFKSFRQRWDNRRDTGDSPDVDPHAA
ncbi:MAG: DUF2852 domain-containing protein [Parvularcula sp.]